MPDTDRRTPSIPDTPVRNRRPPRPWLAFFLGLWAPGLGQAYAGAWRRGAVIWIMAMALAVAAFHSPVAATFAGLVVWMLTAAAFTIWALVDGARQARARRGEARGRWNRWYVYVGWGLLSSVAGYALLATNVRYRAFWIPSRSMEPTLLVGDHLFAEMRRADERHFERGDLVIVLWPDNPVTPLVRRVIGLPGETLEIRAKRVLIDGLEVPDPWAVHTDPRTYPDSDAIEGPYRLRDHLAPFTVPEGSYFVLGDSRDRSIDSRFEGPVPDTYIVGRPLYLYWAKDRSRIGTALR